MNGLKPMSEIKWIIVGMSGFALMIVAIIVFMTFLSKINDQLTSRSYTPLTQSVGGYVDRE
jgi:hypothetical protein